MPERRIDGKDLLAWIATLVAFPFAGLAARAVAGPVDAVGAALLAGAVSGAVIGAAQWLALRRVGADVRWIVATAVGLAAGMAIGYAVFGYGDDVGGMALLGAVSGAGIGAAQWWILRGLLPASIWWIPATAVAWALGWTVTTAIGVDPDDRWANPGLSGAATLTVLLAAVLWFLGRAGEPSAAGASADPATPADDPSA
jgi:hypothetical protein